MPGCESLAVEVRRAAAGLAVEVDGAGGDHGEQGHGAGAVDVPAVVTQPAVFLRLQIHGQVGMVAVNEARPAERRHVTVNVARPAESWHGGR